MLQGTTRHHNRLQHTNYHFRHPFRLIQHLATRAPTMFSSAFSTVSLHFPPVAVLAVSPHVGLIRLQPRRHAVAKNTPAMLVRR